MNQNYSRFRQAKKCKGKTIKTEKCLKETEKRLANWSRHLLLKKLISKTKKNEIWYIHKFLKFFSYKFSNIFFKIFREFLNLTDCISNQRGLVFCLQRRFSRQGLHVSDLNLLKKMFGLITWNNFPECPLK